LKIIFTFVKKTPIYFNFHTHYFSKEIAVLSIQNVIVGKENSPTKSPFSIGIHPLDIDIQNIDNQIFILKNESQKENCWAIGECGLDRRSSITINEQEHIFLEQIKWAMQIEKPIIIHCVKAFSELIKIKKKLKPNVAMIIHGFNNNEQIFAELLKNDFFFSFGNAILHPDSNAQKALKNIPPDRLFLENDDTQTSITDIYETAGNILEIGKDELKTLIINNLKQIKPNFNG
jgi:TatD DNase family protein